MAGRFVDAAETEWESPKYGGPRLRSSGGSTSLRSGEDGSDRRKREGDGATPTGTYLLVLGSTGKFGSSHKPRSRLCGICGRTMRGSTTQSMPDTTASLLFPVPPKLSGCGVTTGFTMS